MKIFSSNQIKLADQFTIEYEPISSIHLMERAGERMVERLLHIFPETKSYVVFSGPGNNGGDGLVMARLLSEKGKHVSVFILESSNFSNEFQTNLKRIESFNPTFIKTDQDVTAISCDPSSIILDALFGIGLTRSIEGLAATLIQKINAFPNFKIAIDIPSGLSADCMHPSNEQNTIKANLTFTIQLPKKTFFFGENEIFVGNWQIIDIGLSPLFIAQQETLLYALDELMIKDMLKPRPDFGHKGTFGHVLIVAGSKGKIGASILSGKASLRAGCGLLTLHVPSSAVMPIHAHLPEAMVVADSNEELITDAIKNGNNFHAIGFGPGMDKNNASSQVLKLLIQNSTQPLIIDADGLNMLAENPTWYPFLNGNTILTPHPGEFDRLTKKHTAGLDRFNTQLEFSKKHGVYIVLKGHHTSITTPSGLSFFNTTGNSGMATAGSGDVLTGIITSLCAQGYSPLHASLLGVFLHGFAGDKAADHLSKTSLIASDIIDHISVFFKKFEN